MFNNISPEMRARLKLSDEQIYSLFSEEELLLLGLQNGDLVRKALKHAHEEYPSDATRALGYMRDFIIGYTYEGVCMVFPMIYTFGADYIIEHGWHEKEMVDTAIKKLFERIKSHDTKEATNG